MRRRLSARGVILPSMRSAVEAVPDVRVQADHEDICAAIGEREATRAAALMHEHISEQ